ncbi:NUDIX hydrolase [Vibrio sp. MA40-2]|uniref:NUDIX hydrolase n=1 Tax=Vibrio sp. MA40-2 TaxID=3391828 RepID=UPI0039A724C6
MALISQSENVNPSDAVHQNTLKFCPQCGSESLVTEQLPAVLFRCSQCSFSLFHNVAAAVMVAIVCKDEILIAIRGRNPGIGMWDFPGGFVDPNESLQQAVARELLEELDIHVTSAKLLDSIPNTYPYKGITYKTCDCFFVVELAEKPLINAQDDVAAVEWVKIEDVDVNHFAFESAKVAYNCLKNYTSQK